ncbi:MAG: hypothetical protein HQK81_12495 [Desulfovibrionaceae bacterium]|nr:hypothetical protein [Desulfovibrionaceae bacterium]
MGAPDDPYSPSPDVLDAVARELGERLAKRVSEGLAGRLERLAWGQDGSPGFPEARQEQILALVETLAAQRKAQDAFWGDIAGANQRIGQLELELARLRAGADTLQNASSALAGVSGPGVEPNAGLSSGQFQETRALRDELAGLERELARAQAAWEAEKERVDLLELEAMAGAARLREILAQEQALQSESARAAAQSRREISGLFEAREALETELARREALLLEARGREQRLEAEIKRLTELGPAHGRQEASPPPPSPDTPPQTPPRPEPPVAS